MRKAVFAVLCVLAASPALAKDVEISATSCGGSCQAAFDSVAKDLVATIDYKAMGPSDATGIIGLSAGVVGTWVPVSDKGNWSKVTGTNFSGVGLAGLQVTKGLPLNIDVGAFYTKAPGTNFSVYGGELRYAILPGSIATPAVALRGSYVKVAGIGSFKLDSKAIDLSLSKGIGPITPYVGVGYVYGDADPSAQIKSATGLSESKVNKTKAYIGARFSLLLVGFTPEIGTVGGTLTYSLRVGFSFSL